MADLLEDIAKIAFEPGHPRSASISYPGMIALYQEDIWDAAAYRGIATLQGLGYRQEDQPVELVSAYAGHNLGLCKDPLANYTQCNEEEEHIPKRHVILFEYTKTALSLHYRWMSRARADPFMDRQMRSLFGLGSAGHPTEADIQEFVSKFLHDELRCYEGHCHNKCPEPVTFIVTGNEESFGKEGLRAILNAIAVAVEEWGSTTEIFFSNPDFVAARGAAEFAWRAKYQRRWSPLTGSTKSPKMEPTATKSIEVCSSTRWPSTSTRTLR
jgi:hypothetical protein